MNFDDLDQILNMYGFVTSADDKSECLYSLDNVKVLTKPDAGLAYLYLNYNLKEYVYLDESSKEEVCAILEKVIRKSDDT